MFNSNIKASHIAAKQRIETAKQLAYHMNEIKRIETLLKTL